MNKFVYSEFGSTHPIRFLDQSQVTMYDSDGKEILCACGKPATDGIFGRKYHFVKCSECKWEEK